jgi:large repetitive protein
MHHRSMRPAAFIAFLVLAGCGPVADRSGKPSHASATPGATSTPTASRSISPPSAPAPSTPATANPGWRAVAMAPMLRPRDGFRALVLGDGSVLVVGDDVACAPGPASPGSETAERYDPIADEWSVAAALNKPRKDFAMVPAANGGVMVIGGINADDIGFSSTKRFDLDAARWIDGPLLRLAYPDPSAVTVADGRIYILGPTSSDETTSTSTVEILAPGRTTWDDGGRIDWVSVRIVVGLDDGRLVSVGSTFESPELLHVHDSGGAEGWRPFPSPGFEGIDRLVPIPDGGLIAVGWTYGPGTGDAELMAVRRYDRGTNAWADAGPMKAQRTGALWTSLHDGRILVAGGVAGPRNRLASEIVGTTEIYDPATDAWSAGPDLLEPRADGEALTLDDGSILVIGGVNALNFEGDTPFCPTRLTSVERLTPAP